MTQWVYTFQEAPQDSKIIGGKGLSLVKMSQAGFIVPPGFIISANAQKRTKQLDDEILQSFDALGAEYVAVRSSAVAEDSETAAWAGQLETFLNITKNTLLESVEACWQSIHSDRAQSYAQQQNITPGAVAVVVQTMIQSEVSGVAFSVHPVTGDTSTMIIEAGLGLGEAVVSGTITPDTYIVQKKPIKIGEKHVSEQKKQFIKTENGAEYVDIQPPYTLQKLPDALIEELAEQVNKLEDYYKHAVDVEWAVANGQLYITQCRPVTTL